MTNDEFRSDIARSGGFANPMALKKAHFLDISL